jgi:thymidine kinase
MLDIIIDNTTIIGNPGCGKTKTIIDYCIHNFTKKSDFLIITFSNKAQNDFIEKGKRISDLFSNYNCKTVHKLACLISKNISKKSSENNLNTLILSTLKLIKNEDISHISFFKNCKIIFIDEAQDINENQYNLILEICNKLKIPLVLVGDPNQSIYQFQGGSDKFLLNHSISNHQLINNYRSSNEIVEFCKYLRPHNDLPSMECKTDIKDEKPYIYINSIDDIKSHILNEIKKCDYPLKDIAIIGPVKLSKNNASIGLQQICNFLYDNDIKYVQYFKDAGKNTTFDLNEKIDAKDDHVNILTIHSSKGLEFKKILCINYHLKTFSRKPTKEDYNIFKYLWYVAFTRAINKLIIYVDENKDIFPFIKKVPKDLYNSNKEFEIKKIDLEKNSKDLSFPIVDTINNNKYFNENNYYKFENEFKFTTEKKQLFILDEDDENEIYEFNKYSALYGCFFHELFNFYWYKNNKSIDDYIDSGMQKIKDIYAISSKEEYDKCSYGISLLKKRGLIDNINMIDLKSIEENKNKLKKDEISFYNYIKSKINLKDKNYIQIIITIDLCEYDSVFYSSLYKSLLSNENKEEIIFNIVLYKYQIDNECKRYLKFDWINHLSSIKHYYNHINNITIDKPNYLLDFETRNNHLNIHGIIDVFDNKDKNIIELKFAKNIDIKYILQTMLYNNNFYFENKMEIINLMTGIKYTYQFINNQILKFNYFLCDVIENKMKNNIIILDIETNTINETKDFTLPENVEIIERYFYEYNFNTVLSEGLIKNKHTLTTSHITGITQEELNLDGDNDYKIIKNDVANFMKYMENPILIAHNGERFDFPILVYHNIINYYEVIRIDTLYKIRLFIKDEIKSNKLINLYKHICNKDEIQQHRAKADVILIKEIFQKLNLSLKDILSMRN